MAIFEGSGVALITPFKDNGVDFEKLKELLEWHVKKVLMLLLFAEPQVKQLQ